MFASKNLNLASQYSTIGRKSPQWTATSAGQSGEEVRDKGLKC
jgi:hypothetical protein